MVRAPARPFVALAALVWSLAGVAPSWARDPLMAAAGDVACAPSDRHFNGGRGEDGFCRQAATAGLIRAMDPDAVLVPGDAQYDRGLLRQYRHSYDLSWGAFRGRTRPVPGNHDYMSGNADGYFGYFGARAGDPAEGYYSFDLGAWHVVALNSNCSQVACGRGSAQYDWLRADLAGSGARCTLAYFHHPRFSSGPHGNQTMVAPFWRLLYGYGADVILSGHDHTYERFAPQTPSGDLDRAAGIREFVVGTGGSSHDGFGDLEPNSRARNGRTYGVLRLRLHPRSYGWKFVPQSEGGFTDSGLAGCH